MKLWNVLVRKSAKTKTDSNCKNCKKFDNNSNSKLMNIFKDSDNRFDF